MKLTSHPNKLGAKIRRAETDKVPHMIVVGAREADSGLVSVRSRVNSAINGTMAIDDFNTHLDDEIASRALPSSDPGREK